ncbi:MAG: heavy metal-binding domain-containing protein [Lachnospiraceae bacterium]
MGKDILLTTTPTVEGYEIVNYIKYISANKHFKLGLGDSIGQVMVDALAKTRNYYINRELAVEEIIGELKKKATGNAIVDFKIDYVYLQNDYFDMIASGTDVDIVKIEEPVDDIPQYDHRDFVVGSYNLDCDLRISGARFTHCLENGKMFLCLRGTALNSLCKNKLIAFSASITGTTVFGEKVELSEALFANVQMGRENDKTYSADFETELLEIPEKNDVLRLIKSVSVYVNKVVTDSGIIESDHSLDMEATEKGLVGLRQEYGSIAVRMPYQTPEEWFCSCGMVNSISDDVCPKCGKELKRDSVITCSKEISDSEEFDILFHIHAMQQMGSAKEMLLYAESLNSSDIKFNTMIIPELKKYAGQERLYGPMKGSMNSYFRTMFLNDEPTETKTIDIQ